MPLPPSPAYVNEEYQSTHYNLFKDSITVPLQRVLPPGVTQYAFDAAILRYMAVVGVSQVLQGEALTEYIDPYELHESSGERKMPSAAVRPKNVEELREVLAISNEYEIPVWTFSRGKNLGCVGSFNSTSLHMFCQIVFQTVLYKRHVLSSLCFPSHLKSCYSSFLHRTVS